MERLGILKTKLYKPDVKDKYVIRRKIIDFLEENSYKPLTMVVAPAGYGKSIAISGWLDVKKANHCWMSLDEEFNDLRTFLSYLTYAVKSVVPDSMQEMMELVKSSELPPDKLISNTLINELDDIKDKLIVVLDDYYFIHNVQIHNIINELLKYPPKNFHLVIITRYEPTLNLSYIRAYGLYNEIRMSDLSFDKKEVFQLARQIIGNEVSEKTAETLLEKTEGWIIGIKLALIILNTGKDIEKTLEEIKGDRHYLTDYLLNEVLFKEQEETRKLLLTVSILDSFNEDLMKKLNMNSTDKNEHSPDYHIENLFNRFRNSTLFIISLDSSGEWFRYHHFFRNFLFDHLKKNYSEDQIREMHRRASEYFIEKRFYDEALRHALKSGDTDLAVRVIEENKYEFIETDQFGKLWKWLGLLPEGTVEKNLSLLLTRAFLCDTIKDFVQMKKDLLIAQEFAANETKQLKGNKQLLGEYYSVYSNLNLNTGNFMDSYEDSKKALELLTDKCGYLRDYSIGHQAFSLNAIGKFEEGIGVLKNYIKSLPPADTVSRMRIMIIHSMLCSFKGYLHEIAKLADKYNSMSYENKLWISFAYSTYYLSETSYQWNKLNKAIDHSSSLFGHYYSGRIYWVLHTLFVKAFSYQVLGDLGELNLTLNEIREVGSNLKNRITDNFIRAFEVELAIRQNNIERALEISKTTDFECINPIYYYYFPRLTYIKLLISSGEPADLIEAGEGLEIIITTSRSSYKYHMLTQALLLQSILFRKKNNNKEAAKVLKEAVKLAEPGGFIRIFVDLGEPMEELIDNAFHDDPDSSYLVKLIQAFKDEKVLKEKIRNKNIRKPVSNLTGVDKLSDKELKLLNMVAERYRNKEIAQKLNLSPDSIKKYLYNIYQKLDVHNRVEAVNKAIELGLIQ